MNDYSYHTVSSIINAFQKSVNYPFKYLRDASNEHLKYVSLHCARRHQSGRNFNPSVFNILNNKMPQVKGTYKIIQMESIKNISFSIEAVKNYLHT